MSNDDAARAAVFHVAFDGYVFGVVDPTQAPRAAWRARRAHLEDALARPWEYIVRPRLFEFPWLGVGDPGLEQQDDSAGLGTLAQARLLSDALRRAH